MDCWMGRCGYYKGSGVVPISMGRHWHHSFNNKNLPNGTVCRNPGYVFSTLGCRILVTMSASSLCLLSMSKLLKIIHNITGSTQSSQSTYISAYISIIMEICLQRILWKCMKTVKEMSSLLQTLPVIENIGSILNFEWDFVLWRSYS
jgi:hypothetical protein